MEAHESELDINISPFQEARHYGGDPRLSVLSSQSQFPTVQQNGIARLPSPLSIRPRRFVEFRIGCFRGGLRFNAQYLDEPSLERP